MSSLVWKFLTLCILSIQLYLTQCETHSSSLSRHPYDITNLVHGWLSRIQDFNALKSLDDPSDVASFIDINPNSLFENGFFNQYAHLLDSNKCLNDMLYTFESVRNFSNQWAYQMFDAYGKIGSGILRGNMKWLGDYNECLNVYAPPKDNRTGNFHGQYCSLKWQLEVYNQSLSGTTGLCFPDSCSTSELKDYFFTVWNITEKIPFFNKTTAALNGTTFSCSPSSKDLTTSAIAVICLLSLFLFFALIGSSITLYEYLGSKKRTFSKSYTINGIEPTTPNNQDSIYSVHHETDDDDPLVENAVSKDIVKTAFEKSKPFFKCFCIFTNGSKLLNTDATEGQLLSIHGIRFLSMTWVILGHTYAFCFNSLGNILDISTILDTFAFQIILQAFYSVDSFFVLSGFLVAYLYFTFQSKQDGKMNWWYFYLHRFIRLTPVYMLVLGFTSTIYFYLGSGPFWPDGVSDPLCEKYWWWNLLYINNFQKDAGMCMAWSWYLANDMQFYIISPLILITLWRWPKIGYAFVAALFAGTWIANFYITYHYDFFPGLATIMNAQPGNLADFMLKFSDYFMKLYVKPYTRIGPYLVGMLLGYILFKVKSNKVRKLRRIELWGGWFVASAITLTCVYGLYHDNPSLVATSFYNAFNRICFALGLSWVMFVCLTDQGGPVNDILSYKLFIPLSRLTYSAYLIHPIILTGYFASLKAPFVISNPTVVLLFLGFIVVTYGLSLPVSLIFESPIIGLEKLVRSKFSKT